MRKVRASEDRVTRSNRTASIFTTSSRVKSYVHYLVLAGDGKSNPRAVSKQEWLISGGPIGLIKIGHFATESTADTTTKVVRER